MQKRRRRKGVRPRREPGPHCVGGAFERPARLPRDERRPFVVHGFDDGAAGAGDAQALAGFDDVIVELAGSRQPDAAGNDVEPAAAAAERQGVAAQQASRRAAGKLGQ